MFWVFECFIRPEPLLWGHGILSCSKETSVFLRVRNTVSRLSPGALVKNADARAPFPTTCIKTQRWELQRIIFGRWLCAHCCLRTTEGRGGERNTGLCSFTAELRASLTSSLSATWANVTDSLCLERITQRSLHRNSWFISSYKLSPGCCLGLSVLWLTALTKSPSDHGQAVENPIFESAC